MVMKPEPLYEAVEWAEADFGEKPFVAMLSPQGRQFTTETAKRLACLKGLVLIAGHYEGFDERVRALCDEEISIGDFVLTGGEIPAMAVIDAVARFIPGVLGDESSALRDSYSDGLLEGPQYTRPAEFRGMKVPEVLLSGDRAAINRWRRRESLRRTHQRRPDLLEKAILSYEDRRLLAEVLREEVGR
jgi:tRNA (guanine37-N1)-methyltransferase